MKYSFYNIFVNISDSLTLLFNSVSGTYIMLKPEICKEMSENRADVETFREKHPRLFEKLVSEGCIVEDSLEEQNMVMNRRLKRRFSNKIFHITINTSMDCNLSCWYCYETHIPNSNMSIDTASKILKHIEQHHYQTQFESLKIGFFGGEPLMNIDTIKYILGHLADFTEQNNIQLKVSITTNGTLLSEELIDFLKNFEIMFQITLDGNRERHNKIKVFRGGKGDAYQKVLESLRLIDQRLENAVTRLRINFDKYSSSVLNDVLNDVSFLKRDRCYIGLHKVWQVSDNNIDNDSVISFINAAYEKGFMVDYKPIGPTDHSCYADNYNQVVFNYNGDVFKCTARNFTEENRYGRLCDDGTILWDTDKLSEHMGVCVTPAACRNCKLFPSCMSFCSQKLVEKGELKCSVFHGISLEEIIITNFNKTQLLGSK